MKSFALPLLIGIVLGAMTTGVILVAHDDFYWYKNAYSRNSSSTSIDAIFIENMIPHHEDAIEMSKLALTKTKNEEVRTLATNIISAQQEENIIMRAWYKTWFEKEVPENTTEYSTGYSMMHGETMMENGMTGRNGIDISNLENAEEFDKTYITQMIPHHQMAIMMAYMLLRTSSREEMQTLAKSIIETQSAEILQMQSWLNAWE
jgi:uncharacterized protein (DUF305 family)